MNEMTTNLVEILKGYGGKWVVLTPDNSKVIASGDTFASITTSLKDGFAMKVPPLTTFTPHAL